MNWKKLFSGLGAAAAVSVLANSDQIISVATSNPKAAAQLAVVAAIGGIRLWLANPPKPKPTDPPPPTDPGGN